MLLACVCYWKFQQILSWEKMEPTPQNKEEPRKLNTLMQYLLVGTKKKTSSKYRKTSKKSLD